MVLGRELKKGFVPLQPQPDPASIVVVKRKYLSSATLTLLEISGFEAMCMLYFALCITFGPIMLSGFVLFACLLISRDGF
jgi:hypothetical protein